ncbi:MAG: hypothetical protein IIC33_10350 [Chloroflexi bacterium]|nr:hypothetical protein [Chloroflexota bacterium]
MGSTRLPGKTLALIGEKTLLQHLVDKVSHRACYHSEVTGACG